MADFLTSTDISGKLPATVDRNQVVLEQWQTIRAELVRRFGESYATILAEPSSENGRQYDWYTALSGEVRDALSLSASESAGLMELALQRLADIRGHGQSLTEEASKEISILGRLILAAVGGLETGAPGNLYSIGGQPVFVDWGVDRKEQETERGVGEITRVEKSRPKKPKLSKPASINWLWLLFAVLCSIIFARLIDGCSFVAIIGGGLPNFCRPAETEYSPELAVLLQERAELSAGVTVLNRQFISPPVCGYTAPAFLDHEGGAANPKSDEGGTELKKTSAPTPVEINDMVRDAGGSACDGIEILAVWKGRADIDLQLYCPVEEGGDAVIGDDRNVGPGNEAACGSSYDLTSEGGEYDIEENVERICMGADVEAGKYYATVYNDAPKGAGETAAGRIIVRGPGGEDMMELVSTPGVEAKNGMPVEIEQD